MLDERSAAVLDGHIAILMDNIRILTQQGCGASRLWRELRGLHRSAAARTQSPAGAALGAAEIGGAVTSLYGNDERHLLARRERQPDLCQVRIREV
jgi:hypothetical protein